MKMTKVHFFHFEATDRLLFKIINSVLHKYSPPLNFPTFCSVTESQLCRVLSIMDLLVFCGIFLKPNPGYTFPDFDLLC